MLQPGMPLWLACKPHQGLSPCHVVPGKSCHTSAFNVICFFHCSAALSGLSEHDEQTSASAAALNGLQKAACSSPACSQHGAAETQPRDSIARLLVDTAGQSSWFFGGSSLAEDVVGSVTQPYQSSAVDVQFTSQPDVAGGLRTPSQPNLQDEGSGMIWNGKGVAPIIKSALLISSACLPFLLQSWCHLLRSVIDTPFNSVM